MTITLPASYQGWLEEQAAQANQSVDEYVQKLIEEAQVRLYWKGVEPKVSAALDGAPALPMTAGEWDRLKRRITDRFPETTRAEEG